MREFDLRPTKNEKSINLKYSRVKRKFLSHVMLARMLILGVVLAVLIIISMVGVKTYRQYNLGLYFKAVYNFWQAPVSEVASSDDRTNILVMGKAGGSHDGPELTDTIMLVSISLKSSEVKIISIPRDTWIPEIRAKINSAYYWGNQKPVGGINFAKVMTSSIVGVPIHYAAVIDFSGFEDIIDELGGINVDVEDSFTDYYYPIAGKEDDTCDGLDSEFMCRYETLHFDKGVQLMDGTAALKFVRSRHAEGINGTDIAREARQGKVIAALKNKLSDKNTYRSPTKDLAILRVILRSIQTDIDYPTAAIIARRLYNSKDSIESSLIPSDLLVNPTVSPKYDMQSVFTPRGGNGKWEEINNWVINTLK